MLSVILPVHNGEKSIAQTIDSIINQTLKNIELIIINDFSDDNTECIIKLYCSKYSNIKLINLKKNYGACFARNEGIKIASGRFISFIDADDIWLPQKADDQIKFMLINNCHFSYTNYQYIRDGINLNIVKPPHSYNLWLLMQNTSICLSTVVYDSEICGKVYFNDVLPSTELHLYLRLFTYGYGLKLNKNLCLYNLSPTSMSGNKIKAAKIAHFKYKHYLGMNGVIFYIFFFKYLINAFKRHSLAKFLFLIKKYEN